LAVLNHGTVTGSELTGTETASLTLKTDGEDSITLGLQDLEMQDGVPDSNQEVLLIEKYQLQAGMNLGDLMTDHGTHGAGAVPLPVTGTEMESSTGKIMLHGEEIGTEMVS
jgi:hypothetical protein